MVKSFDSLYFEMNGRKYKIIGTRKEGRGRFIHTVKNDKGEYKDYTHEQLIELVYGK